MHSEVSANQPEKPPLRSTRELWRAILQGYQDREAPRSVDAYMEEHIVLPEDSPWPGPYRFHRLEAWREVAKALSPADPCHQVTIMASPQTGKSTLVNGAIGFYVDADPSPAAIILPTAEDAPDYQQERLGKLYEASPRLRAISGKRASRDLRDNERVTEFATGARLLLLGSAAASTYRSRPIRLIILDDLDVFAAAPEGDHVKLAMGRTGAYRLLGRKILCVSSPGLAPSRIAREYDRSSQEQYWVPCPHCGAYQVLDPARLVWDRGHPASARIVCVTCGDGILQEQIPSMLRLGEWRALCPERRATHRGFWLWQGYLPIEMASWSEYAHESEESMRALREDNDERPRQTFVSTRNARPWEPAASRRLSHDAKAAYALIETPWEDDALPLVVRTVATDCQHDRLESTLVGWGRKLEAWALDHQVHRGSILEDEVWDQLQAYLLSASTSPAVWIIDAGDGRVHNEICAQLMERSTALQEAGIMGWAVKNFAGEGRTRTGFLWPGAVHPGNPKGGRFAPVSIYADAAIGWVYEGLTKQPRRGQGVLHVPNRGPFKSRAWWKQVYTKRARSSADRPGASPWIKPNKRARDEALDCLYLSRVAVEVLLVPDARGQPILPEVYEALMGSQPSPPPPDPPPRGRRSAKRKRKPRGIF